MGLDETCTKDVKTAVPASMSMSMTTMLVKMAKQQNTMCVVRPNLALMTCKGSMKLLLELWMQ